MCVSVREIEDRGRDREREYVCVCVYERLRERESVCVARLTIEALLCRRDSWGMRGGFEGETGGEMERSWTLAGFEKEAERTCR